MVRATCSHCSLFRGTCAVDIGCPVTGASWRSCLWQGSKRVQCLAWTWSALKAELGQELGCLGWVKAGYGGVKGCREGELAGSFRNALSGQGMGAECRVESLQVRGHGTQLCQRGSQGIHAGPHHTVTLSYLMSCECSKKYQRAWWVQGQSPKSEVS